MVCPSFRSPVFKVKGTVYSPAPVKSTRPSLVRLSSFSVMGKPVVTNKLPPTNFSAPVTFTVAWVEVVV